MLPAALVNAAGLLAQLPLNWFGKLVTSTVTVQVEGVAVLAGTVLPFTVMMLVPATAVTLPPVHVPPTFGTAATCKPAGKVSVKLTVCAGLLGAGLVSVNV